MDKRYDKVRKQFFGAITEGNYEEVKKLISQDKYKLVNANTEAVHSGTPLHCAAQSGGKEIVDLLIAKGASIEAQDDNGCTPLHVAAEFGCTEMAEFLIAKGAVIEAKDIKGGTPLHFAVGNNRIEEAKLLISCGADVNAKDTQDLTPLHYVAQSDSKEMAKFLIENGADIYVKASDGTPLDLTDDSDTKDILKKTFKKVKDENKRKNLKK